jgi:hypothetical protein
MREVAGYGVDMYEATGSFDIVVNPWMPDQKHGAASI